MTQQPDGLRPDALAAEIEAAIARFHDALPQGQGEQGDGGVAGRAMCQLFYDNSDTIVAALTRSPTVQASEGLVQAATQLSHFAWSCATTDCEESRAYLQSLLDNLRAAIAALQSLPLNTGTVECRDGGEGK